MLVNEISGQICVVGRCDFHTGIGYQTYAFAELFSRYYPTCIQPTEIELQSRDFITLPNGRDVPVWRGQAPRASIFVDVFWNGAFDRKYLLAPECGLRLATLVWDSDVLPYEWVELFNNKYDMAVALSPHLVETAKRSGVTIPCMSLPLPLDIEAMLAKPFRAPGKRKRIGSVAAFHPRKNTRLLVDAFIDAFKARDDVELFIHSNLAFPGVIEDVNKTLAENDVRNVTISTDNLSASAKDALIESFDIFTNLSRGEGYSIGPREALSLGKVLVLSRTGAHVDLAGSKGVFMVEPELALPARFPEIDNRVFGQQFSVTKAGAARGLLQAVDYLSSDDFTFDVHERRNRAAEFSFSRLSKATIGMVEPMLSSLAPNELPRDVKITEQQKSIARTRVATVGGFQGERRRIVQMHDGGFFSIFNSYFSNLVWDLKEERCHATLPDWDVGRFLTRREGSPIQSFCYGKVSDGNIWTKLFEPVFGMTDTAMQSEEELYRDARPARSVFNEHREPLMTYIHAARLYGESWFPQMRREYHRAYTDHIRLKPEIQDEIDAFCDAEMAGHTILGAHVRHPSHTVEQPGGVIAHADDYIRRLEALAERRGLSRHSDSWRIFLATDQERVIHRFQEHFGDRLVFWGNARRTSLEEDSIFDNLSEEAKKADGYQLQHIVASDRRGWSTDMAVEVIRDAYLMSRCHSLFHVVSNVSTAVSYLNPECDMIYCND